MNYNDTTNIHFKNSKLARRIEGKYDGINMTVFSLNTLEIDACEYVPPLTH